MNTDLLYYWANQFTPLLQLNMAVVWCLVCFNLSQVCGKVRLF